MSFSGNSRVLLVDETPAIHRDLRKVLALPDEMDAGELGSGRIVGMEALVRWSHPSRGLLLPNAFTPIAERTGAGVRASGR
jgi:EAL domain-containing protein (putative c-di-GMP-specific phosphodiesterase class I)